MRFKTHIEKLKNNILRIREKTYEEDVAHQLNKINILTDEYYVEFLKSVALF